MGRADTQPHTQDSTAAAEQSSRHRTRMGAHSFSAGELVPAVALGLALGVASVFIFFPLLLRFIPGLRHWGPIHYTPISDIPVRC